MIDRAELRSIEVHDWDPRGSELLRQGRFRLLDTTLRDGVQTPGIKQPTLAEKLAIIDFDAKVGVEEIDVCLPSDPGIQYFKEGVSCARYLAATYPNIDIVVLTRTIGTDVDATIEFARQAGVQGRMKSILFRGTSDLRLVAEDWTEDQIIEDYHKHTKELVDSGIRVIAATEDTTRTRPEFLEKVFEAGRIGGAEEFCIADTVGYADSVGIETQMTWLRNRIGEKPIHFHGHDDTRNAVGNTIAAMRFDAVAHVTWLGVGERAGNTPIEGILSDLLRRGIDKYDPSSVVDAAKLVATAYRLPIPANHPLVGENVYKSESGIHVAAIAKARNKGREDIAGKVYSPVDPRRVGRKLEVSMGPLGGVHAARWVLEELGVEPTDKLCDALQKAARVKNQALTNEEIKQIVGAMNGSAAK